jgi:transcription-repair coupling factor (superfamily II helicase)
MPGDRAPHSVVEPHGPRIITSLNSTASPVAEAAATAALPTLIHDVPDAGKRMGAGPFAGSSDALALADLARRAAAQRRMVAVVSAEPRSAQRLAEEVPWFAPELRVALLPDWETLPYDQFSPHQDLVSERLATLYRVSRGESDLLIV